MNKFLSFLESEILVCDGAIGTMLQKSGLPPGSCPEEWNLSHPEVVKSIHQAYVKAGANIITTNTFGGNRISLSRYGLIGELEKINGIAVKLAKEAGGEKCFVAGSMGPTGKFLEPFGEISFDEALEVYKEQAKALVKAGVDILIIETMVDLQEIRAAVIAAKMVTDLPVIAQMGFTKEGRTVTGTDPLTAVTVLESLRAEVVGANCMTGPEEMLPIIEEMAKYSHGFLIAQPNGGMPQLLSGETVYPASPELIAEYGEKFVEVGVNIVGSCCGTTPDHTRALAERVRNRRPIRRIVKEGTRLASRSKTVFIGKGHPFCIVGERINPSGRKDLTQEIREGKTNLIQKEAIEQVNSGAHLLDINVSVSGTDEKRMMEQTIKAVQNVVSAPLVLDTMNLAALDTALKIYAGKALINPISGERKRMEEVLPLVKKYGAAVVGLTLDEKGIPNSIEGRLAIAERIIQEVLEIGIKREDILIDSLVLTVGSEQEQALITLKSLERVRSELGVSTILGISNISYGLPKRSLLNSTYLTMALSHGLDAAILNPYDQNIQNVLRAGAVLTGQDLKAKVYISQQETIIEAPKPEIISESISDRIINGNQDGLEEEIERIMKNGEEPLSIVNNLLIPAIKEVGRRFEAGDFFLPHLILSSETMRLALSILKPYLKKEEVKGKGRILLATVKGDIHDIGKNIVGAVLESFGFIVLDLGKDVPSEIIVETAKKEKVDIVGLSALMTTTMVEMKVVLEKLKAKNVEVKTMVGGAVLSPEYAREIGASAYARDAIDAVRQAERLMSER